MSYWVSVECHSCGCDQDGGGTNMTSNLAKMWRAAGCDVATFDDRPAFAMLPSLVHAIRELQNDPEHYRKLEPGNGWGDLEGCIRFLEKIRDMCCLEPLGTVRVSH